jgi:hypothetical protein
LSAERVTQWCDVCRQADTDPRHHVATAEGTVITRHMDCCRNSGCPDLSCDRILQESGQAHGSALIAHITGQAV